MCVLIIIFLNASSHLNFRFFFLRLKGRGPDLQRFKTGDPAVTILNPCLKSQSIISPAWHQPLLHAWRVYVTATASYKPPSASSLHCKLCIYKHANDFIQAKMIIPLRWKGGVPHTKKVKRCSCLRPGAAHGWREKDGVLYSRMCTRNVINFHLILTMLADALCATHSKGEKRWKDWKRGGKDRQCIFESRPFWKISQTSVQRCPPPPPPPPPFWSIPWSFICSWHLTHSMINEGL